jgi:hypothetical protein
VLQPFLDFLLPGFLVARAPISHSPNLSYYSPCITELVNQRSVD